MLTEHFWDSIVTSLGFLRPSATKKEQAWKLTVPDVVNRQSAFTGVVGQGPIPLL